MGFLGRIFSHPDVRKFPGAFLWTVIFVAPMFVLSTIFCGSLSYIFMWFDKSGDSAFRLGRFWSNSLCWFAGAKVTVEGLEHLDSKQNYIFCPNHLSYMDTPVIIRSIFWPFRFLAKTELFSIPFMGTHLKQAGHVPVPLEDPRASIRTLTRAAEMVQQRGISLLIFPEGGRSESGKLEEFKDGAAYLAIKAQVPVVPIALMGTREILAMHSPVFHRGPVRIRVGTPIPTTGLTIRDRETVTISMRGQIEGMLARP